MITKERLVELLTTPMAESRSTLILEYVKMVRQSAELLNNAIENDKILIAGREAGKIQEMADIIAALLDEGR